MQIGHRNELKSWRSSVSPSSERQHFNSLGLPIYIFKLVDITKLPSWGTLRELLHDSSSERYNYLWSWIGFALVKYSNRFRFLKEEN